ncbi:MAG: hypothetical protein Kow0029_27390 [Candidatus Rifleibacteriota bacterium]
MCKRSVLVKDSFLPGLFTILLVITLIAISKPGVCNPRFIYSESNYNRSVVAEYLETVPSEKRGLQAIFWEGSFLAEQIGKLLPNSRPSIVAGGCVADINDIQEQSLTNIDPDLRFETLDGKNVTQIETYSATNPGIPKQWNFVLSGVETIKNFYTLTGKNRTLGVISMEYPYGHVSLQGKVKRYRLFGAPPAVKRGIKDLHLVHPLGLIVSEEATMFEGIAPDCNIILAQISQKASKADTMLEAIEWLVSLDTPPDAILFCTDFSSAAPQSIKRALNACRNAGIIPIVPAGNNPNVITGIAALPACVTVGSINRWKQRSLFSGAGPAIYEGQQILKPDCVEPGEAVLGPTDHIEYKFGSGTLQAAAHFAGIYLLVKEALPPETSPETIVNALLTRGEDLGEAGPDYENGYGLPSPVHAINYILYPPDEENKSR